MYIYIKRNTKNKYIELAEQLSSDLYNIGTTWLDYVNGKYVLLSDEQVAYRDANPSSTVSEVWYMRVTPVPERTLELTKLDKKNEINSAFDSLKRSVKYEDKNAYLDKLLRVYTKEAAKVAVSNGIESFTYNDEITINSSLVEKLIDTIILYEIECDNLISQKESEVDNLSTIDEVDAYEYESSLPSELNISESDLQS